MFGSPRSATSTLLDKGLFVLNPAIGLATICILRVDTSGVRLGTTTGTESGKLSVSHRKYREAVGREERELTGRETSGLTEFV